MSRGRELRQRLHGLGEIREILSSMKSLSVMETHKLSRFGATQQRVLAAIERAAADFCRWFPATLAAPPPVREACLLLGSERGFCGDFNERLLDASRNLSLPDPLLLAVGSRLGPKLEGDPRLAAALGSAGVAEEVPVVIGRVVETLGDLERRHGSLGLTVLSHELDGRAVAVRRLLPPFQSFAEPAPACGHPPRLYLPAEQLASQLIDHYLFAALHALFYATLTAENQRRANHLEGAIRRLDETLSRLNRQANALRQEEITEEIEVILLSGQE